MDRSDRARRAAIPTAARSVADLGDRRFYEVAFRVAVPAGAESLPAERWIRATFEDAPRRWRWFLVVGWTTITCRLHLRRSPSRVLGWTVEQTSPDVSTIMVRAWVGLTSRIVTVVEPGSVTLCSFVGFSGPTAWLARVVWALTVPLHERVLPLLLTAAARRAACLSGDRRVRLVNVARLHPIAAISG